MVLFLYVPTMPGGGETLTVQLQLQDPVSGWGNYVVFPAVALTGYYQYVVYPGAAESIATANFEVAALPLGRTWRVNVVHSGSGSWTYSLGSMMIVRPPFPATFPAPSTSQRRSTTMSTALRTEWRGATLAAMQDHVAGVTRTYHLDHQGTVQCLTDDNGVVTDRFSCDAWGNEFTRTGTSINRHWYIGNLGHYRHVEQALDYVRARWFCPHGGTWVSQDPLQHMRISVSRSAFGSFPFSGSPTQFSVTEPPRVPSASPYEYCRNSPTSWWDASGLFEVDYDQTSMRRIQECLTCAQTHRRQAEAAFEDIRRRYNLATWTRPALGPKNPAEESFDNTPANSVMHCVWICLIGTRCRTVSLVGPPPLPPCDCAKLVSQWHETPMNIVGVPLPGSGIPIRDRWDFDSRCIDYYNNAEGYDCARALGRECGKPLSCFDCCHAKLKNGRLAAFTPVRVRVLSLWPYPQPVDTCRTLSSETQFRTFKCPK